jgi:hypothetical protein
LVADSTVQAPKPHLGGCQRCPKRGSIVWIVGGIGEFLLDLEQRLVIRNAILEQLPIGGSDVRCEIVPEDRDAPVAHAKKATPRGYS